MAETGGESEPKPVTDPLVAEIHKRISDAFDVFDHDHNKTVDVRCEARVAIIHITHRLVL